MADYEVPLRVDRSGRGDITVVVATPEPCPYPMRQPCARCGEQWGYLRRKSGQDIVRCCGCDAYQYAAPRFETGADNG